MIRKSFGRSLSFPIPSQTAGPKIKGRGSASLPVRFHPFVSHLHDEVYDLLTWQAQSASARPDPLAWTWIGDGLARLDRLHSSLDDLLQHPQAQDPLRRRSTWTARLLDDFLRFADAYSSLRSAVVVLKGHQSATQAAIRRNDGPRIASCVRFQRKAEKELIRIAAQVRGAGRWVPAAAADSEEAEIAGAVREVSAATASASAAAIAGIAEMSAEACSGVVTSASGPAGLCGSLRGACMVGPMVMRLGPIKKLEEEDEDKNNIRWRTEALERLEALEDCIGEVEVKSERLFKSLVNTRVFLLNILTPSL